MSDYDLPDLPSDEELGIDGLEFDEESGDVAEGGPEPDRADGGRGAGKKSGRRWFGLFGRKGGEGEGGKDRAGRDGPERESGGGGPGAGRPSGEGPGPGATGPRGGWRGPVTLLLVVLGAWLSTTEWALPRTAPLSAPDTAFSSGRAMVDLAAIARQAHPPGSPEHARVREFLLERLTALGLEPSVHTAVSRRGGDLATVRNVVARLPGEDPTGAVVLTAHYDGRGHAVAAGDDGAGVVTILETVRALRASGPLRNDVIVLLTDAEELGLMGARAFVRDHPWMDDVSVVLSVEMRGGGGVSIMFETAPENGWIVDALAAGDPRPFANSMSAEVYRRLPNDTDFTPFRERGIQGLNFAAIGNAHVYHQAYDSPENLDERTVQHHGLHVLGMVRELGARDLSDVKAPDRVYFNLPFLGLITYPPAWVIPLTAWVVLVLILAGTWGWRTGMRPTGLLAGLGLGVVSVGGAAAGGWGLFRWVRRYHPEFGALHGSSFHSEGWYVLALVAFGVALTAGLLALARRRFSLGELALGAQVVPLVAVLGLTFLAPMAAMNLQWPALAAAVAAGLVATLPTARGPGRITWGLLLVLAVPVLVLMVRLIELLWLSMNFSLASVLAGLVVVTLLMLLPLLDTLLEPNGWWAPLAGVVLAAGFVGLGLRTTRPTVERPAPSTLIYALDHDVGTALWASRGSYRWEATPRPGLAWARFRTGTGLSSESPSPGLLPGSRTYGVAEAPSRTIPRPAVTVVGDSVVDGSRRLAVAVRSRVGAEIVAVEVPSEQGLFRAAAGEELAGGGGGAGAASRGRTSLTHFGVPAGPDGSLVLDVEVEGGVDAVDLVVEERHLRPGELVGEAFFRRPPGLAPNIVMYSDRAILRGTARLVLGPDSVGVVEVRRPGSTSSPDTVPADSAAAGDSLTAPDTTAVPDSASAADSDSVAPDSAGPGMPDSIAPDTTAAAPPDSTVPDTTSGGGARVGAASPGPREGRR